MIRNLTSSAEPFGRLPTGIEGFDDLIEGGFLRGDLILLAGNTGSGKSTFSVQFAYNAALNGEKVLYASLEEGSSALKRNMLRRGFDLQRLEDEGKLTIVDMEVMEKKASQMGIERILDLAAKTSSTIVILDSISALLLAFKEMLEARTVLHLAYKILREPGCTTLVTLNIPYGANYLGLGLEEAISDALILLENRMKGIDLETRMLIYKMRGTSHSRKYHAVLFEDKGVSLLPYVE